MLVPRADSRIVATGELSTLNRDPGTSEGGENGAGIGEKKHPTGIDEDGPDATHGSGSELVGVGEDLVSEPVHVGGVVESKGHLPEAEDRLLDAQLRERRQAVEHLLR